MLYRQRDLYGKVVVWIKREVRRRDYIILRHDSQVVYGD